MKLATIKEAVEKFGELVSTDTLVDDSIATRIEELNNLEHQELVDMIISYERRKTTGIGVGELARAILTDEDFITLSNGDVADVCRQLIPGSHTSHKSIASYVSKKREEWNLPTRITIRRAR